VSRRKVRQSTVPASGPAKSPRRSTPRPQRRTPLRLPARALPPGPQPRVESPSLIAAPETSLVDIIDNLLNRGVVLNADLILALADVDLVYVRLSALLCAADRIMDRQP
jgi:gas vesicle protein GvpA/GvpJ/GvpM family